MSMENLLGISLERLEQDPAMIKRLLVAAERNIAEVSAWLRQHKPELIAS